MLRNKHVQVHGDGRGSRLLGVGIENVLQFNGCASVELKDLAITADTASPPGGAAKPHLTDAVTAINCDHVNITNVLARSASAPTQIGVLHSGLHRVHRAAGADVLAARRRLRTGRGCESNWLVGRQLRPLHHQRQLGARGSHRGCGDTRPMVAGQAVSPAPFGAPYFSATACSLANAQPPASAIVLTTGHDRYWIEAPGELRQAWPTIVQWRKFPNRFSYQVLGEFLKELAEDLIFGMGTIGTHSSPAVRNYLTAILSGRTSATNVRMLAAQGIVVAGTVANEVRVIGNTVRDSVQGHPRRRERATDARSRSAACPIQPAGSWIDNNVVAVALMAESSVERHGVFVGNVLKSDRSEQPNPVAKRVGPATRMTIDGIRIYGFIGPMGYVSRNDMAGFTTGVRFAALNNKTDGPSSIWRVADNVAIKASAALVTTPKAGDKDYVSKSDNKPPNTP